jgi:hypothetical protein
MRKPCGCRLVMDDGARKIWSAADCDGTHHAPDEAQWDSVADILHGEPPANEVIVSEDNE